MDKSRQRLRVHIIRLSFLSAFVIDNSLLKVNLSLSFKQSRDNNFERDQNLHLHTFNWLIIIHAYFCFAVLMRPERV